MVFDFKCFLFYNVVMRKVVIDLFSGSGGSALGFKQAGYDVRVAVDIDKDASKSFQLNFPEAVVLQEDICPISGKQLLEAAGEKDGNNVVLIACPPCQGFSTARRKSEGRGDPRNKLVYEFLRIVGEIKPSAFVMENVPGLATGNGKEYFEEIRHELEDMGYSTVYKIINAIEYGIPQKRRRLVLIGIKNARADLKFPEKTHADPLKATELGLKPWKTVRSWISDLPPIEAGTTDSNDPLHRAASLSELNLTRIKSTPVNGGSRTSWPDELVLNCHKNVTGYKDIYGRMSWDSPSPTMTGGCVMISKGRFGHPDQNRAITMREAARLQTFPDNYIFTGTVSSIAKQIGNAVPPLLAKILADWLTDYYITPSKAIEDTTSSIADIT